MPPKKSADFVKVDDLRKQLKYGNKVPKEVLLKDALDKKLITEKQYEESLPIRRSVLKCYLYSVIKDEKKREIIEKYVLYYSQLYIRGTYIANLLVNSLIGNINIEKKIDKIELSEINDSSKELFNLIENNNVFKQIFLPERWPTKTIDLNNYIEYVMNQYGEILNHLLLSDYNRLLPNTGWDNAINMMYIKYRANIENHITLHLFNNCCEYLKQITETEDKKLVLKVFSKKQFPCIISNDDYEYIMNLRSYFGDNNRGYINKTIEYNIKFLDLHFKIIKTGCVKSIYLPIASFGRKYAYLDTKISQNLFKDRKNELVDILGIDKSSFKTRNKIKRNNFRKHKKCSKNKRKNGVSGISKYSQITTIETDGIGLSINLSTKYKENKELYEYPKKEDYKYKNDLKDPVYVGIDFGRAKIFTASIKKSRDEPLEKVVFTRGKYYYEIKHKIRKKETENHLIENPEIQNIINQLSLNNGKKNIENYITNISIYSVELKKEYIHSKYYALWKMRLFRLRKKSKDLAVREIIKKADGRPLVIGIGDAGFPSSGKNEQSVPTTSMIRSFVKQKFIYHQPIKLICIDEFNTTKRCSSCGMENVPKTVSSLQRRNIFCKSCFSFRREMVDFQNHSSMEFHCHNTECQSDPIVIKRFTKSTRVKQCNSSICQGKCRDRDIVASRNILQCVINIAHEIERPHYLCRSS